MSTALKDLRIVFLGTPDFAVASLDALVKAGAHIVAVVTAPDKPAGRGMQLQSSAVKKYAVTHGLPVLQPLKLKDPHFVAQLEAYKADLQVVVAFRMLPVAVWDMPGFGTINVHASLLPQYRGAAPINWAVMNGEKVTGVTTFRLKHEIDTGDILLQKTIAIEPDDNAGSIHDKLMYAGAELLVQTVEGIAAGTIEEKSQSSFSGELKHAPKIFKEDMRIDWGRGITAIHNHIRGLSPYPAAFSYLHDKQVKIYAVHTEADSMAMPPGMVDSDQKTYLRYAAGDGWVYIDELQLEGKKRMRIDEFLRGYRFP